MSEVCVVNLKSLKTREKSGAQDFAVFLVYKGFFR